MHLKIALLYIAYIIMNSTYRMDQDPLLPIKENKLGDTTEKNALDQWHPIFDRPAGMYETSPESAACQSPTELIQSETSPVTTK